MFKKLNRHGRWPNWLNKELLTELKNKNILYGRWKRGEATNVK